MGRPKRILQNELPYHLTSRTVDGLYGFMPHISQMNEEFQAALMAEWKGQNKPTRKSSIQRLAQKAAQMFFTPSERNAQKGIDRPRYDSEAVMLKAREERLRERQEKSKKHKSGKKKNKSKKKSNQASNSPPPKRKSARKYSKAWFANQLQDEKRAEKAQFMFKYFSRELIIAIVVMALWEIIKMGFQLHHFVLMGNHYHMLGTAAKATIDKIMHKFNWFIAKQMNLVLGRKGAFFAERYKSNIVGTDELGAVMLRYIYQNPVRAKLAILPEDHDFTTFLVYVKGEKFRVDISGECPIIQYLCPDKEKQGKFLKELVRGQLPPELCERLRFALRRHVVWMTADTYERLSEELKEEVREHYIKLDESLKRYDLYSRL